MQRKAVKRASKARGEPVTHWFVEKTPGAGVRPELDRLRKLVRGGGVPTVWVYRLDRLSRGGILETLNIVHELRGCGCKLETVGDGFSLQGPAADVVLAVFAWVAEMERAAIRERMQTARAAVEASGGHWGRPVKLNGRRVAEAKELAESGRTVRSISQALKVPKSTVSDALSGKGPYQKPTSNHLFAKKK